MIARLAALILALSATAAAQETAPAPSAAAAAAPAPVPVGPDAVWAPPPSFRETIQKATKVGTVRARR